MRRTVRSALIGAVVTVPLAAGAGVALADDHTDRAGSDQEAGGESCDSAGGGSGGASDLPPELDPAHLLAALPGAGGGSGGTAAAEDDEDCGGDSGSGEGSPVDRTAVTLPAPGSTPSMAKLAPSS